MGIRERSCVEASIEGFVDGHGAPLSESERDSLGTAPERMTLELCARFVTDALEETYFAWDASRFPAAGEHNAVRAAGQWSLYEAIRETRDARSSILDRVFLARRP